MDRKFLRPLSATLATLFATSAAHASVDLGKAANVFTTAAGSGVAGATLELANADPKGGLAASYAHESHSSHSSHASHSSHSSHSSSSF